MGPGGVGVGHGSGIPRLLTVASILASKPALLRGSLQQARDTLRPFSSSPLTFSLVTSLP